MHASSQPSPARDGEHHFSVLLFAGLRDAMKRDEIKISIAPGKTAPDKLAPGDTLTVAQLLEACAAQFPPIAAWLPHVRVAVNCEYCDLSTPLQSGDEIALIPPVAGG